MSGCIICATLLFFVFSSLKPETIRFENSLPQNRCFWNAGQVERPTNGSVGTKQLESNFVPRSIIVPWDLHTQTYYNTNSVTIVSSFSIHRKEKTEVEIHFVIHFGPLSGGCSIIRRASILELNHNTIIDIHSIIWTVHAQNIKNILTVE